jgi:hypothetical protein
MTPLLAIEIDNNQIFVAVVGVLGPIFALYIKVRSWEKSLRGEAEPRHVGPQPFEVSIKEKPLSHSDHDALCGPLHQRVGILENDVRAIRLKMDADKTEIIAAGEMRAHAIHERINTVLSAVSEVRGEIKHLGK